MYTTIKFHPEAISIRNQIICIIAIVCLSSHISHAQNLPGFRVNGRYLYDYNNEKVILRGANAMIVYWDKKGLVNYPELSKTGANCCRIFWNLDYPAPTPADLDITIQNCLNIQDEMFLIFCKYATDLG